MNDIVQKESIAAPSHLPSKGRDPTGRELQIKQAHRPGKNQKRIHMPGQPKSPQAGQQQTQKRKETNEWRPKRTGA